MRLPLLFSSFIILLVSCTHDAYETGDSRYSYLRADFVEAQTDASGYLVSAISDDEVNLVFSQPTASGWANKPDSLYRSLLYYNIDKTETDSKNMTVEPVTVGRVYVLTPILNKDTLSIHTDPVHFQSSWKSKNKKYFNLSLALMTGVADSIDARQSLGLLCDSVVTNSSGSNTFYYRLLHDQGGVPEYYRSTIYISLPTKKMTTGDVVRLSLNTYDGVITKEFNL